MSASMLYCEDNNINLSGLKFKVQTDLIQVN